jgi:hypothetical protein
LALIEKRKVGLAVLQPVISWMFWIFEDDLPEGRQQIDIVARFNNRPVLSQMYLSFAKIILALR